MTGKDNDHYKHKNLRIGRQFMLTRLVPLLFVFFWSTGFIGAKYALPFIEPFYLLFLRVTLTALLLFLLCLVFNAKWPSLSLTKHQLVVGFLIQGTYSGGVFGAIALGLPTGVTAIVVGMQPVLTALLGWQMMGEKLHPTQWLGLILGFIGIVTIILRTTGYRVRPHNNVLFRSKALHIDQSYPKIVAIAL